MAIVIPTVIPIAMITVGPGVCSVTIEHVKLIIYENERMKNSRSTISKGNSLALGTHIAMNMQAIKKITGNTINHP